MREKAQAVVRQGKDKNNNRLFTTDFSLETLKARRKWNNTTKKQKEENVNLLILCTVEMSYENEDK